MKPNEKELHFFDLDGTLWDIDTKVWILDKEEPHKPIIRIDYKDMNRILNGFYKQDGLKIEYNGEEFYISKVLFNKIINKKKIPIERLGISWIEFYDEKYINNTKVALLFKNVRHLRNKDINICLLTGRAYQDRYSKVLNTLRKKLDDIGINIYKIYFVSEKFYYKQNETISLNKAHILLEHLIGLKIDNGKFKPFKQDWYNNIYFYDDEKMNIDYANDMQKIFENVLKNTDDELFKLISERISNNTLKLTNNLITNNEVNMFETTKLFLNMPIKYTIKTNEHVRKYNNFLDESSDGIR